MTDGRSRPSRRRFLAGRGQRRRRGGRQVPSRRAARSTSHRKYCYAHRSRHIAHFIKAFAQEAEGCSVCAGLITSARSHERIVSIFALTQYRLPGKVETTHCGRCQTVCCEYARCYMANCIGVTGKSGDLFGEAPIPRRDAATKHKFAPEIKTARVLCRQLRHKQPRPEKQRIAHLICLSLLSMLRHSSQR